MEHSGDIIGRYQLLRQLGAGGMGTVWLAKRADGSFRRDVALKLLHGGERSEGGQPASESEGRFLREREILSSLDHPGIARILDAGELEDGRPFCAMEVVDGVSIDEYCDGPGVSDEARLDLLVQAARALGYAHSQHVIHRDVKPQNLMVTTDRQVKLIDFGIARTGQRLRQRDAFVTQGPLRYMTPEFASPEQVAGQSTSASSDVFSLARVADIVLRPEVRTGDLEAVLSAALHPIPEERYATAEGFATDLENVRAGRPIAVRERSSVQRIGRLLWRNRDLVAAAAIASAILVAGLVIAHGKYRGAQASLDEARSLYAATSAQGAEHEASLIEMTREGLDTLKDRGAKDSTRAQFLQTLSDVALQHEASELRMVAARSAVELAEQWLSSEDEERKAYGERSLRRAGELLAAAAATGAPLPAAAAEQHKELSMRLTKLQVP